MVTQSYHPHVIAHRSRRTQFTTDRVEAVLFLAAICIVLFVIGLWLRNTLTMGTPPVMTTITVRSGDTLWGLAARYGDPDQYILERVHTLAKVNRLEENKMLREGQTLLVPVAERSARSPFGGRYASTRIGE